MEVDLARINPAGVAMDADPNTVLAVLRDMKKKGKGVIGMKILGAGKLRDRADECLQFALSLDCVDCFTIGSGEPREMEDLVKNDPGRQRPRASSDTACRIRPRMRPVARVRRGRSRSGSGTPTALTTPT